MQVVSYSDRVAAIAAGASVSLAPAIAGLPDSHPVRRFVAAMTLFAHDVEHGRLPGPYSDARAAVFARCRLIASARFRAHRHLDDLRLARVFGVPVGQIAAKRQDLGLPPARPTRWRAGCQRHLGR